MAVLDSSSLGSLVKYIKSYVTNQISSTLSTGTITKAISDAQGNVISETYATNTYVNSNFLKSNDISVFIGSGSTASSGLVPTPPTTAGTTKYLREDGTWQSPPVSGSSDEPLTNSDIEIAWGQVFE